MKKYYIYFDNRDKTATKIGIGLKNPDFVKPAKNGSNVGTVLLIILLLIILMVASFVVCKKKIKAVDFGDLKIGRKNSTFRSLKDVSLH